MAPSRARNATAVGSSSREADLLTRLAHALELPGFEVPVRGRDFAQRPLAAAASAGADS